MGLRECAVEVGFETVALTQKRVEARSGLDEMTIWKTEIKHAPDFLCK
jgi:hypothetical protein